MSTVLLAQSAPTNVKLVVLQQQLVLLVLTQLVEISTKIVPVSLDSMTVELSTVHLVHLLVLPATILLLV